MTKNTMQSTNVTCPICGGRTEYWGILNSIPIIKCRAKNCKFRFLDIRGWNSNYKETDYYDTWTPAAINDALPWIRARIDIIRNLRPDGVVADLGCGIGETAIALSKAGYETVGIDESPKSISYLKEKYPSIKWKQENIMEFLENTNDQFDIITLFHILEHIPNPKAVIELIDRALRPSGYIIVEVPDVDGGFARLKGSNWEYYIHHHVNYFSVTSLEQLMSQFGFKRRYLQRTYHFSHPQGSRIKDPIKAMLAYLGLNSIIRTAWSK